MIVCRYSFGTIINVINQMQWQEIQDRASHHK